MQKFTLNIFHKKLREVNVFSIAVHFFMNYVFKEERIYRFYTVGYGNYEIFFFFLQNFPEIN